jgi:hypothetical protein
MSLDNEEMRDLFRRTKVVRKPTYGIVSGYHELPYVCLGPPMEAVAQSTEIRGVIHVSPRFVLRPAHHEPSYQDVFGEENVDVALAGRLFGFFGLRGRPVECTSDHLNVTQCNETVDRLLSKVLDDLERREDITTGVIVAPDSRYYPVSVERFIASVLEDEFKV